MRAFICTILVAVFGIICALKQWVSNRFVFPIGGWTYSNSSFYPDYVRVDEKEIHLKNWVFTTNSGHYLTVSSILRTDWHSTNAVKEGQVFGIYQSTFANIPKVHNMDGRTWTNYWQRIAGHAELIRVIRLTSDDYALCDVQMWGEGSTAYLAGRATLLKEYLARNAALIPQ